jgi:hypothetical protein
MVREFLAQRLRCPSQTRCRDFDFIVLGLVFCMFSAIEGCARRGDEPRPNFVAVTGTIRLDGKLASGVFVVYRPTDKSGQGGAGRTDEVGRYEIKGRGGKAGVTPGEYRVTCAKLVNEDGSDFSPGSRGVPKRILPARYSEEKFTTLRTKVARDAETIDFDLKSH